MAALEADEGVERDGPVEGDPVERDGAESDDAESWARLDETGKRTLSNLTLEGDRLEVFSPTRGLADDTRTWLEGIAGGAIEIRAREHVDPASDKARAAAAKRPAAPVDGPAGGPGGGPMGAVEVPPELRQQAIEELYVDWLDVPIPALRDETPRQAMATSLGRERLTELLREYEQSERQLAEWEGREPVSFDFLWRRVGLEPAKR